MTLTQEGREEEVPESAPQSVRGPTSTLLGALCITLWPSLIEAAASASEPFWEAQDTSKFPSLFPTEERPRIFVGATLADFGLPIWDVREQGKLLQDLAAHPDELSDEKDRAMLALLLPVPSHHKLWCYDVLCFAFRSIIDYLEGLQQVAPAAARAKPPIPQPHSLGLSGTELFDPAWFKGKERVEIEPDIWKAEALGHQALFQVVFHIPTQSSLCEWFEGADRLFVQRRRGSRPGCQAEVVTQRQPWFADPCDETTWGFEIFSGPQWDELYAAKQQQQQEHQLAAYVIRLLQRTLRRLERAIDWQISKATELTGGDEHPDLRVALADITRTNAGAKILSSHLGSGEELMEALYAQQKRKPRLCTNDVSAHPATLGNRLGLPSSFKVARGYPTEHDSKFGRSDDICSDSDTWILSQQTDCVSQISSEITPTATPRATTPVPSQTTPEVQS